MWISMCRATDRSRALFPFFLFSSLSRFFEMPMVMSCAAHHPFGSTATAALQAARPDMDRHYYSRGSARSLANSRLAKISVCISAGCGRVTRHWPPFFKKYTPRVQTRPTTNSVQSWNVVVVMNITFHMLPALLAALTCPRAQIFHLPSPSMRGKKKHASQTFSLIMILIKNHWLCSSQGAVCTATGILPVTILNLGTSRASPLNSPPENPFLNLLPKPGHLFQYRTLVEDQQ